MQTIYAWLLYNIAIITLTTIALYLTESIFALLALLFLSDYKSKRR